LQFAKACGFIQHYSNNQIKDVRWAGYVPRSKHW